MFLSQYITNLICFVILPLSKKYTINCKLLLQYLKEKYVMSNLGAWFQTINIHGFFNKESESLEVRTPCVIKLSKSSKSVIKRWWKCRKKVHFFALLCFSVFAVGNEESNCIKKNNYLLFLTQWEITLHLCFFHFDMEFIKTFPRTENRGLL